PERGAPTNEDTAPFSASVFAASLVLEVQVDRRQIRDIDRPSRRSPQILVARIDDIVVGLAGPQRARRRIRSPFIGGPARSVIGSFSGRLLDLRGGPALTVSHRRF